MPSVDPDWTVKFETLPQSLFNNRQFGMKFLYQGTIFKMDDDIIQNLTPLRRLVDYTELSTNMRVNGPHRVPEHWILISHE